MEEDQHLESSIRAFLAAEFHLDGASIKADTALVSSGLVDSAALIRLAALVERECDLIIPDRDVSAEHFDSIRKIRAYVAARLS
jgi:acyl carrier protein